MSIKLRTPSNGSVTLSPQDTTSDVVLTVPAVTGTVNTSGVVNEVPAGSASSPAIYPTGDTNTGIFFPAADTIAGVTGGVERWRTDSSGDLLVRCTTSGFGNDNGTAIENGSVVIRHVAGTGGGTGYLWFTLGGSAIGSVAQNGSTGVSYNTTSDYRLKENVQPMQNALATVAQLNPVTWKWKSDGSDGQGFIAHELQAAVPDCVTGEKDAVDKDGKPLYQGVDTSFLVATLTKAIQELNAKVEQLQAQIGGAE